MSGKYNSVLYNEINPLVVKAFKMAVNHEFDNENRWISRDDFFRLRDSDPYVALCFSFSSNLKNYAFSPELEPWKEALHYARIFNDCSKFLKFNINTNGTYADIRIHLKEYREKYVNWIERNYSSLGIEKLNEKILSTFLNSKLPENTQFSASVQRLNRLKNINTSAPIECSNISYENYKFINGDVVYCDPPYENTLCGGYGGFNSDKFYDWVVSRNYQVFFSSYSSEKINNKFHKVFSIKKRVLSKIKKGDDTIEECIYSNLPYKKKNFFVFGV